MNRQGGDFPQAATGAALGLTNLLNDVDTLSPLLVDRIAARDTLNAFLVAAGLQQIAEDHLHRDPFFLHRAAGRLRRRVPTPLGRIASTTARGAGGLVWQGTIRTPRHRVLAAWLDDLTRLGQRLAAQLMETQEGGELASPGDLEAEARSLAVRIPSLPPLAAARPAEAAQLLPQLRSDPGGHGDARGGIRPTLAGNAPGATRLWHPQLRLLPGTHSWGITAASGF